MLGYSSEEMLALTIEKITHPGDIEIGRENIARSGNDTLTYAMRYTSPRIVGQPRSVSSPNQVMCDNHGPTVNQQLTKPNDI